jgi:predicted DNA-binding protein
MSDYPYRKNVGLTQEIAERLAFAADARAKSEPYLIREFLEVGLSSWEAAQQPTIVKGNE